MIDSVTKDTNATEVVVFGDGYIPRDGPVPEEILNFDASRNLGGAGDHQVLLGSDRKPTTVFDEIYVQNASRACAKCVGHCCRAFALGSWANNMKETLARLYGRVRESRRRIVVFKTVPRRAFLKEEPQFFGKRSTEILEILKADLAAASEDLKTGRFFSTRLRPADNLEFHPQVSGSRLGDPPAFYQCTEFDVLARRCKVHDKRPTLCRRYICGPATAGFAPPSDSMVFGVIEANKKRLRGRLSKRKR